MGKLFFWHKVKAAVLFQEVLNRGLIRFSVESGGTQWFDLIMNND